MSVTAELKVNVVFDIFPCSLWLMVEDDVVGFSGQIVVFCFLAVFVCVIFSADQSYVIKMYFLIIQNGDIVFCDFLIEFISCEFCFAFMIAIYKINRGTLVSRPSCLNRISISYLYVYSSTKSLPSRQKFGVCDFFCCCDIVGGFMDGIHIHRTKSNDGSGYDG